MESITYIHLALIHELPTVEPASDRQPLLAEAIQKFRKSWIDRMLGQQNQEQPEPVATLV